MDTSGVATALSFTKKKENENTMAQKIQGQKGGGSEKMHRLRNILASKKTRERLRKKKKAEKASD